MLEFILIDLNQSQRLLVRVLDHRVGVSGWGGLGGQGGLTPQGPHLIHINKIKSFLSKGMQNALEPHTPVFEF